MHLKRRDAARTGALRSKCAKQLTREDGHGVPGKQANKQIGPGRRESDRKPAYILSCRQPHPLCDIHSHGPTPLATHKQTRHVDV